MARRHPTRSRGWVLWFVLLAGGLLLLAVAVATYLFLTTRFDGSAEYGCEGPERQVYEVPYRPVVERFLTVTEVWVIVEGPIEEGRVRVEVSGWPAESYAAGEGDGRVAYRKAGEWQDEELELVLEPSSGARCSIRIFYEFLVLP